MSALLYSQALELFIYCLIMMWVLTALLLRIHTGDLARRPAPAHAADGGRRFSPGPSSRALSLLFFPRYTGKLGIKAGRRIGRPDRHHPSGLHREAGTGRFRGDVRPVPHRQRTPPDAMYWRAMVLWNYEDGVWTAGPLASVPIRETPRRRLRTAVRASSRKSPSSPFQKWLFASTPPSAASPTPQNRTRGRRSTTGTSCNCPTIAGWNTRSATPSPPPPAWAKPTQAPWNWRMASVCRRPESTRG